MRRMSNVRRESDTRRESTVHRESTAQHESSLIEEVDENGDGEENALRRELMKTDKKKKEGAGQESEDDGSDTDLEIEGTLKQISTAENLRHIT